MDKSVLLLQALFDGNRVWVRNDLYVYVETGDLLPDGLCANSSGLFRQVVEVEDEYVYWTRVDLRLQDFILLANHMSSYEWLKLHK